MALSYNNDDNPDDRLNPANNRRKVAKSISEQEKSGAGGGFNDGTEDYRNAGDPSNSRNIAFGREQSGWRNAVKRESRKNTDEGLKKKAKKIFVNFAGKKRGATVVIIAALGGSVGMSSFFFTGFLAPIAWGANVINDLNDQLAALDIRNDKMLRAKISSADRDKALSGCSKLSIRCKFRTMSANQVEKLNRAGIRVVGDDGFNGRTKPTKFVFTRTGKEYTPQEFSNALGRNGDPKLRSAYKRGINMKYIGVSDKTFVGRTLARWGLSRKPPELSGSHEERVNAMMNRAQTGDVGKIRFVPVEDGEDGSQRWAIEGDNSGKTWTTAETERMQASLDNMATKKPPSLLRSNTVKAIGVIGAYDMACTINNAIGMATIAAKVANSDELSSYAMTAASMTGAMQSGELSYEDSLVLQEFFNKQDERKMIPDIEGSFTVSGGTGGNGQDELIPSEGDAPLKDNPYYGKSVMDSPFYQLSSTGNLNSIPQEASLFSLGVSQNALLNGVSNASQVLDTILNFGSVDGCKYVQNWFVRGASIIGGIALGLLSGGSSIAVQATIAVSLIAVSMIAETVLNNALSGDVIHDEMDQAPYHRAAAQWTGTSVILGETARSRGMIPGSSDQLLAYQELQATAKNEYVAAEREVANPFDVKNQYSLLGSIAIHIGNATNWSPGTVPGISNVASIVGSALPMALGVKSAYADLHSGARYEVCDDEAYDELNIDPDIQCNVRYYLPAKDLELDSMDTALWMEQNNYVADETATGLPEGYTPPNPAESHSIAESLITGFTDQFFASRNYSQYPEQQGEYAKFLDYCAYRIMPWGKTYEESSGWGGAGEGWVDGSKCLEDSEMLSRFRIYTFDKTVQSGIDDEEVDVYDTPADSVVNESPVIVSDGVWAKPNSTGFNRVTQSFGNPVSYNSGYPIGGGRYGHNGVDLAGSRKSERVYAACSGSATTSRQGEYTFANTIVVNCGSGITVGYHHAVLTAGSSVSAGQDIGYTDLSGLTTGHHLHLTVKVDGSFVNPIKFFTDQGIPMP